MKIVGTRTDVNEILRHRKHKRRLFGTKSYVIELRMYKNLYINTTIKLITGILEFKMVHKIENKHNKKIKLNFVNNIVLFILHHSNLKQLDHALCHWLCFGLN